MGEDDELACRWTTGDGDVVAESAAEIDYEYVLLCCIENAPGRRVSRRRLVRALVTAGHRPVTARHLVATAPFLGRSGQGFVRPRSTGDDR